MIPRYTAHVSLNSWGNRSSNSVETIGLYSSRQPPCHELNTQDVGDFSVRNSGAGAFCKFVVLLCVTTTCDFVDSS